MVEKSEIMDDNENYLELSKMNFSPFTTQFANVNVNQFAKFTQNLTTANGQVLSLVSGADGLQFLQTQPQVTTPSTTMTPTQTYITLPITVPGSKPGEAQQTFQIQVLNPNQIPLQQQAPKFQMSQMQIPIHGLQQHGTTVLTVAYSPQDGEMLPNHGQMQDGPVTVLAAIQPQDLQLLAQQNGLAHHQQLHQQQQQQQQQQLQQQQQQQQASSTTSESEEGQEKERHRPMNIKSEPQFWSHNPVTITAPHNQLTTDLTEYLHARNMNLQPYFKINTDAINIKKELYNDALSLQITDNNNVILNNYNHQLTDTSSSHNNSSLSNNAGDTTNDLSNNEMDDSQSQNEDTMQDLDENEDGEKAEVDSNGKVKKKRKMKKKTPKPKRPKPGQVHIATALDGTILFCCPECQMAYPEKESLEQHLVVHKIERRYICDICGAGLKRKEHLERHKLGHNSERPFVCSVCLKGFKRKEHLNLHFVIHSGLKTEICLECGKGFYRKDHLRKHIKSHQTKRMKEANATVSGSSATQKMDHDSVNVKRERFSPISSPHENQTRTTEDDESNNGVTTSSASLPFRCMPQELTFHVGSAQIKLPHLVTTTSADGTSETIVVKMPSNL